MNVSSNIEYPLEYFIEIEGQSFLIGRLTIHLMDKGFWVSVDIVQNESKKIWAHAGDLYGINDLDEVTYCAVQLLADYLKKS
jgi:hypothetical protein